MGIENLWHYAYCFWSNAHDDFAISCILCIITMIINIQQVIPIGIAPPSQVEVEAMITVIAVDDESMGFKIKHGKPRHIYRPA